MMEYSFELNLFLPVWDFMLAQKEHILSSLWRVCLAFSAHFVFSLPFLASDVFCHHLSWIKQYRISNEVVSPFQWLSCSGRILRNYIICVLPFAVFLQNFRPARALTHAPPIHRALFEVTLCMLVFDTLFFWLHLTFHRFPRLYYHVHRAHHRTRLVYALAAQDFSLGELLSLQVLSEISTSVVGCHPLSEALFHMFNIWLSVEDHCGYSFPWAVHRLLPWIGGAPFHQAHHLNPKGNYAPYFTHWDRLCGTYVRVRTETRGEGRTK